MNVNEIYTKALIAGLCFHASQQVGTCMNQSELNTYIFFSISKTHLLLQVSYMILGKVSPVTHSVGNCVKRVIVIGTSVIFFHTQVSPINALGKLV